MALAARVRDEAGFVGRRANLGGIHELEVVFDAGVEALTQDAPRADVGGLDAERAGQMDRQRRFRLVQTQPQVGNTDGHGWQTFAGSGEARGRPYVSRSRRQREPRARSAAEAGTSFNEAILILPRCLRVWSAACWQMASRFLLVGWLG